eukprot:SAG11_NODE_155_length_14200_cov_178.683781_8_plen_86_part_00
MSKELVKKVDQDWFNHMAHIKLHEGLELYQLILNKWQWGAYGYDDKMNKHLKHDLWSLKSCLDKIKEALPEGADDDTFLIHNQDD